MSEWLTARDVAAEFGIAESTVRKYYRDARLRAYKVGPHLVRITSEDAADFPVEFTVALQMKRARALYPAPLRVCEAERGKHTCILEAPHKGRHSCPQCGKDWR